MAATRRPLSRTLLASAASLLAVTSLGLPASAEEEEVDVTIISSNDAAAPSTPADPSPSSDAPEADDTTGISVPSAEQVSLLYALSAGDATMRRLPGSGDRYAFVLKKADPRTVWFSNRPARHSGTLPTSGLVQEWSGLGFTADPPNVAITVHDPDGETETIVAVMRKPSFDARTRTLRATMQVLSDERAGAITGNLARHGADHDAVNIPPRLGSVSLFIDDVNGTVINGCLIQPHTSCRGANLEDADLSGAKLNYADFTGANLSGANLDRASVEYANFTQANLSWASMENTFVTGYILRYTTWIDGTVVGQTSSSDAF